MDAFSASSDEIMLTICQYERGILDKTFPVSMGNWKMIFKTGLQHYKERYPNIRYVEVGNEYAIKSFMDGTAEEYYQFYQRGSQAVREVNDALELRGDDRILVGGPVVTGDILDKIDKFLNHYTKDASAEKRIDFVSWHDYRHSVEVISNR